LVKRLCYFATIFALIVVMLGAYTRLSDAGLGCPDWPGCYGEMIVPQGEGIEQGKAWKEMTHRYVAGTLGLMILGFFIASWRKNSVLTPCRGLTTGLLFAVIFQALLGMWTVTLLLHPTIVMGHLLGGMTIISLLWLLTLRVDPMPPVLPYSQSLRIALALGLTVVVIQIALGGWTSANYAAMACPDFPTCREVWIPELDFKEAFSLLPSLDHNYEGGWLAHPARVTIHYMHRVFAVIVLVYVGSLSLWIALKQPLLRQQALITLGLLLTQVALGISNIVFALPLAVATAHNGVAALLLLALVTLNTRYWQLSSGGQRV
jgi:cytochrome c oxidase assembly protein subunit 15